MQLPAILLGSVRLCASFTTLSFIREIKIMSSFFQQVRTQDQSAPVTLLLNEESLQLVPDQYRNKSLSQLFAEYGASLGGDVTRINRYLLNGEIVPGETVIRAGETVRGSVTSESKGIA